jgi:hypothetical protein
MRITRDLCTSIERAEVAELEHLLLNARKQFPEILPDAVQIGGGVAIYAGVDSPLSEATGIGIDSRAGKAEVDALTRYYAERDMSARVRVSPLADGNFVRALVSRGFEPLEYENLLVADLAALDTQRDVRVENARNLLAWSRASAEAFAKREPTAKEVQVAALICTVPENTPLEVREGNTIVATACMSVNGDVASFFAASTQSARRGRGLHRAMVADRMARAVELGAKLARVTASPATSSEQNFRRAGFVPVYTRTTWVRRLTP